MFRILQIRTVFHLFYPSFYPPPDKIGAVYPFVSCFSCSFFPNLLIFRHLVRRHDLLYHCTDCTAVRSCSFPQLNQLTHKFFFIHLDRFSDMDQLVLGILQTFFIHEQFFIQFFPRTKSSSCQDRNNFFSEFFHKTMNYCIILKNSIKKRVPDFSETLLSIIFLLFLLSYLPIQQIILFSNTFKNQFFCPHI